MILISKKSFNKIAAELDLAVRIMSDAKIDVYGDKDPLVKGSGNRDVIPEKTYMQKRFENWLNQTKKQPGLPQKKSATI